MTKLRAIVLSLSLLFLPLVAKGGGLEAFDIDVMVSSGQYGGSFGEPYVEVAVYSVGSDVAVVQAFTTSDGRLLMGALGPLPGELYVEVQRDRVDGVFQRVLPPLASEPVEFLPGQYLWCVASYKWDTGLHEAHCWVMDW